MLGCEQLSYCRPFRSARGVETMAGKIPTPVDSTLFYRYSCWFQPMPIWHTCRRITGQHGQYTVNLVIGTINNFPLKVCMVLVGIRAQVCCFLIDKNGWFEYMFTIINESLVGGFNHLEKY